VFSGALPAFGLDPLLSVLALARGVWLACLFSATGALLFAATERGSVAGQDARFRSGMSRLIRYSFASAGTAWVAWVVLQAAVLAAAGSVGQALRMLPVALGDTSFGHVAIAQALLLCLSGTSLLLPGWLGSYVPAVLALAATGLQVGHLHAWAMEGGPGLLTASTLLHLCAAATWLGALLPLRLLVRTAQPALAAAAVRRFSRVGTACVLVLAATALIQGSQLVGGVPGLLGTAYGWMVMLKAVLFATLIGFALHNRFRLAPGLARPDPLPARSALIRSIRVEAVVGLAIVIAATRLSALQPGMHAQPVWPFSLRPNFSAALTDGAGYAAAEAVLLLGVGALVVVAALVRRRSRLLAFVLAAAMAWLTVPLVRPLFVPADPTSFYRSPTGFAATAIADGEALYAEHCATCHGAGGRGDGPDARRLPVPPADLASVRLAAVDDGELFWSLSHAIAAPAGGVAMPDFSAVLDEDQRWDLIDFLRARNAGLSRAAGAARPVRAPDLEGECGDGRSVGLADLRGKLVRLVFQQADTVPVRLTVPGISVVTLLVPRAAATEAGGGDCIVADPAVLAAYAVVTGVPPAELAGAEIVIDQNGWLREVLRPGADTTLLAAALGRIAAAPLADVAPGG
jgi:putative copper export protein/mono/diheme cytochrome c family protein